MFAERFGLRIFRNASRNERYNNIKKQLKGGAKDEELC